MPEADARYPVVTVEDESGHRFGSVHIRHPEATGLVIHFSAFFGRWGDSRRYRDQFQGYFHRLKMLGSHRDRNWLFLCDPYGAFDNGCYYAGEAGDLFVERATRRIIDEHLDTFGYEPEQTVTMGSSMGATGALRFGIEFGVRGIVAICPHIDLDTSAEYQNRMAEVGWICPDGDPLAPHNHRFTRAISAAVGSANELPRLFVQSCADDVGVHAEQVLPLVATWRARGDATLDARPEGGHTSDFATRGVLVDAATSILEDRAFDLDRYRFDPSFAGRPVPPPISHRIRRRLSPLKARLQALLNTTATSSS